MSRLAIALLTVLAGAAWWACGGPAAPSGLIKEVVISGPAQVAPGASAQLTATAKYTDGSTRDVTSEAAWRSVTPDVLRVTSGGSVQAVGRGETVIGADFQQVRGTKLMLVLEPGTYKLYGRITEERESLEGATVEVVSGTGTGLKTTTDVRGQYALYGVAGSIRFRVSAHGFEDRTQDVTVSDHVVQNIELTPMAASLDLTGSWRMTISAAPDCSSQLPDDVRQRAFEISITQAGSHLTLVPSSPTMVPRGSIEGRIFADSFSADLAYDFYYISYALLDRASSTDWVGIRGSMAGTSTATSIDGVLSGAFDYYHTNPDAKGPGGVPVVCQGNSTFTIARGSSRPARRR